LKRPRKKKIIVAAVVLVAAAAIGLPFLRGKPPLSVRLAPAEKVEELKAVVNGSGEVRTRFSVDIQAEIAGVIIELPVKEGDTVKKGQVLLRIDPFQTETDVQYARAQLSALEAEAAGQAFQVATAEANLARDEYLKKTAEVEVRQAETNLARARLAHEREKRLLDESLSSTDQFELSETQLKLNQAYVDAALSRVEQLDAQIKAGQSNLDFAKASRDAIVQRVESARSTLRRNEDLFSKTTIRSPLDGIIIKLNVEAGERAVPGILSNPQATLMTIADFSIIEAELKVDETDIVDVKLDDPAAVVVDALPDVTLAGRVVEIGNSPITMEGMGGGGGGGGSQNQAGKDFKVVVKIDEPPATIRPGMSCEADITTAVKKDVLVVPIQALTMREVVLDEKGRYVPPPPDQVPTSGKLASADAPALRPQEVEGVFLYRDEIWAIFQPVKTGIIGEMDIEVIEGLIAGDQVVVGPLKALRSLKEREKVTPDTSRPFKRRKRGAEEEEPEEGGAR
jgi:HlyD family secretion protein